MRSTTATISWAVETTNAKHKDLTLLRGETIRLQPTFLQNGDPFPLPPGATVKLIYRTATMTPGSYYEIDGQIDDTANGVVSAVFSPADDAGATLYGYAFQIDDGGAALLRSFGELRMEGTVADGVTGSPQEINNLAAHIADLDNPHQVTPAQIGTYTAAQIDALIAGGGGGAVSSVNGETGVVVLDPDDLDDTSTAHKFVDQALIDKVSGIESGADVTDTANVTAAGALMDSEVVNLADVKAFDPADYEPAQTPASQAEMEAGTESSIRSMSPENVAQAVAALGGEGVKPADQIAPFFHTLTRDQSAKAAKFLSTKATAISGTARSTTGYCRILNADGTLEPVEGTGNPSLNIAVTSKTPISPYNSKLTKFYAIFPCNIAGNLSGELTLVYLNDNQLTSFDGTGLSSLGDLRIQNNQLTSFVGTGLGSLTLIHLNNNQITSFDGTGMSSLITLRLDSNQLTSFVGTGLGSLTELRLEFNQLTTFDPTGMGVLNFLDLSDNQLTTFTANGLSSLIALYLINNQLVSCDLTGFSTDLGTSTSYYGLGLQSNSLSGPALDAMYTSIGAGTGWIRVDGNPGTSSDDPTIATAKGYTVFGS